MVDRVAPERYRLAAQRQACGIQQGGQIGDVAVLAAVAQHQRLAETAARYAEIVVQHGPDARHAGQRCGEHAAGIRAVQRGGQFAQALLACHCHAGAAGVAEDAVDLRRNLQQTVEQIRVIRVERARIGGEVVRLHHQCGQLDGGGRAGGEAAAVVQRRASIGGCQMPGSERGGTTLRMADRDPARRQRCGAQILAAGFDEVDGIARGSAHMQIGMVTWTAVALVVRSNHRIALCQELIEEAAVAFGLVGAGHRGRTAIRDALGAMCPGHHRPAACRRLAGGQVQQAGAFGQLAAMIRGAVVQLVGLRGLGWHP